MELAVVQVFSEKCTGRYFKVRDDDLSSKQGSLCTIKKIGTYKKILKNIFKYIHIYIYLYLL